MPEALPPFPALVGGQRWKQPAFPYHERYLVLLPGPRCFALLDPTRSIVCTEVAGRWRYTPKEAERHLRDLNYEQVDK